LRLRNNRILHAPDAVAYPQSEAEVHAVLQWAATESVAVVPFGGGTSVVGGVEALSGEHRAVLAMDLKRLHRVLDVDSESGIARIQAGILGPVLEQTLNASGLSLGHFPQSFEFSTLGGWLATRSAGQNSTLYGKIEDLAASVKMIAPTGEILTRNLPASASGPEFREVLVGSEGTLGVITEATMRVHAIPNATQFVSYFFRDFSSGFSATRQIMHAGLRPAVFRLSDETETRLLMTLGGADRSKGVKLLRLIGKSNYLAGCHMMLGFEGDSGVVKAQAHAARRIARQHDCLGIGSGPGHRWEKERFELPYFRDTLLDMGIMVDTFETAAPWARLPTLHQALRDALPVPLILAHISHAYTDGASLYITWLADAPDPDQALELWSKVKKIAGDIIQQHGATISHHHAIGIDHMPWLEMERGHGQMQLLRAAKQCCDPTGIMNPGKLIPDA
jgi:alkyldihydroxyacetonephosphate synthase